MKLFFTYNSLTDARVGIPACLIEYALHIILIGTKTMGIAGKGGLGFGLGKDLG